MTLRGCFPVLCTPFDAEGAVDAAAFDQVVDFALGCSVQGVVFPGTASEVGHLTQDERAMLIARLGARLDGRVPFVAGATADTPEAVSDHIAAGAAAGATVAMVMAPKALGQDVSAHLEFFRAIDAPIPLMLQNAPAPFGAGLKPAQVAELARALDCVDYVKEETLPCGANLSTVIELAGDSIKGVFGGAGGRYITDELARGALGTVPAVEIADLHTALIASWETGDLNEARRLFAASLPMLNMQAIFRTRLTKEVLRRRGVIGASESRHPDPRMDAGDLAELGIWCDWLSEDLSGPKLIAAE
ncbi:Dihydrodipicolinate synthase family [Candidatus Rhodobacter oscarellae]|uniref:Dihydrodipicolinate synthase family n=1 Tax=Candidatus Rhodobacter oscarellae TaxID=1675527 RepID=A0A0J9E6L2_9RHOB|nr:dihydrodipicolinate synthase family protein [Candidatus Rhodobacter lobularis]KMW58322.1 Dihydrodipicolinate synthase family [Candidatus Rhodobacter lobularis]